MDAVSIPIYMKDEENTWEKYICLIVTATMRTKIINCMPSADDCSGMADIFKQLSDGSRLRILWMLCHLEECVSNIAAAMEMSDPAVSHHLKQLKSSGLIVSRRDGKEVYYKLADTETARLVHKVCEEMFQITCPLEK